MEEKQKRTEEKRRGDKSVRKGRGIEEGRGKREREDEERGMRVGRRGGEGGKGRVQRAVEEVRNSRVPKYSSRVGRWTERRERVVEGAL